MLLSRDLLGKEPQEKLEIKLCPDGSGQLYVPGLTEFRVQSVEDINKVRGAGGWHQVTVRPPLGGLQGMVGFASGFTATAGGSWKLCRGLYDVTPGSKAFTKCWGVREPRIDPWVGYSRHPAVRRAAVLSMSCRGVKNKYVGPGWLGGGD